MPYFVVSLDGGGVRGVYQARVIERLQQKAPFLHRVNFFCGTSIGAANAAILAKRRTSAGLVDMYRNYAKEIFGPRDWLDDLNPFDELIRAKYNHDGLAKALGSMFDEGETLGDLATRCMVVTFDLDNMDQQSLETATRVYKTRRWKPKYGHNFDLSSDDSKTPILDWLFRSMSAPTYFPSHQGYVDGGVVDNNPAAAALAKSIKEGAVLGEHAELLARIATFLEALIPAAPPHLIEDARKLVQEIADSVEDQVFLLSIGTGLNPHYITGEEHDYGPKQWILGSKDAKSGALLDMLFDGMLGPPDYICRSLLNGNYHRINPELREVIELDEADKVDELIELADGLNLDPTLAWLEERFCPPCS